MINSKTWIYKPPEVCDKNPVKLFALQRPYSGSRINSTKLKIPVKFPDVKHTKGLSAMKNINLPEKWSWRERGTNKIEKGGLRDQGGCGGCWAFSVISCLGDRYALKYNIASPYLSSVWLISNTDQEQSNNSECEEGGNTYVASKWIEDNYIKLEKCWPYSILRNKKFISPEPLNHLPDDCCFNCCGEYVYELTNQKFNCLKNSTRYIADVENITNSYSGGENDFRINVKSTIHSIKTEIMNFGPVVSSFATYNDFLEYWQNDAKDGKIYIRKSDKFTGGHAVVLTGWGKDKETGIEYWEVRNSWGNTGDKGYCKIAMSTSTPKNKWIQIDIPLYKNNSWLGGVITFLPGELDNKNFFEKGIDYIDENEKKKYEESQQKEKEKEVEKEVEKQEKEHKKINFTKIIIYVLLFILAFVIVFKLFKKNKNYNYEYKIIKNLPVYELNNNNNINPNLYNSNIKYITPY